MTAENSTQQIFRVTRSWYVQAPDGETASQLVDSGRQHYAEQGEALTADAAREGLAWLEAEESALAGQQG
ncbi:hypothetical protein [Kineococcus esterisolvens]|uniref:hypothetical protein n=1 Tax=unclassified Kineococcus TaxID=2621656 RepID=UPI003D7D1689